MSKIRPKNLCKQLTQVEIYMNQCVIKFNLEFR